MTAEQLSALTYHGLQKHAAALKPATRMLIDGKLVYAKSGKQFETVNPATDEVIASVPSGDLADVDLAVASPRKAFKSGVWSRMELRARMAVMYRFADQFDERRAEYRYRHAPCHRSRVPESRLRLLRCPPCSVTPCQIEADAIGRRGGGNQFFR
jgi:hypothetical protein